MTPGISSRAKGRPDAVLFQEAPAAFGAHGFAAGMLVIGLLAGFGGGFVVGQRMTPLQPPPGAAAVPRPLPPPHAAAPARQDYTESSVVEPPRPPVAVRQPDVRLPTNASPTTDRPVARAVLAPDEPGTLQVASRPAGATVYLDNARVGTTPMTMSGVAPGTHRVRLELPGHSPWMTSVNIEAGAQAHVGASLE